MHKANKRIHDFEASVIRLPRRLPPALGAVCYSRLIPHFCAPRTLCPWPSNRPSHLQLLPMTYQCPALTSRSFPALNVSVHTWAGDVGGPTLIILPRVSLPTLGRGRAGEMRTVQLGVCWVWPRQEPPSNPPDSR